jgi:predicted tellurium resistance membrane protein TerC
MELLSDPNIWIAFATLLMLEIVLGIDNIVFISILAGKLPLEQQAKARFIGLGLALVMRILLLFSLSWVIGLVAPLFTVFGEEISGRDLVLIIGGLFLLAKSTHEIHSSLEGPHGQKEAKVYPSFASVLIQIIILDAVFSLDSVITAVGMVEHIEIMVAAVVISIAFMMIFAGPISRFVQKHPTVKMLALSFLLLIGMVLVADGLDQKVPKGYIYFAMGFSIFVEMINLRIRNKSGNPVDLHKPYVGDAPAAP